MVAMRRCTAPSLSLLTDLLLNRRKHKRSNEVKIDTSAQTNRITKMASPHLLVVCGFWFFFFTIVVVKVREKVARILDFLAWRVSRGTSGAASGTTSPSFSSEGHHHHCPLLPQTSNTRLIISVHEGML